MKDKKSLPTREEYLDIMATIEDLPLFSSYHRAQKDLLTYKEWLLSIDTNLLKKLCEHKFLSSEKREDKLLDEDLMATVMVLHAYATDNTPITDEELTKKIRIFQIAFTAVSVNKEVQDEAGVTMFDIVFPKKWENFLKVSIKLMPNIKLEEKNI